MSTEFQPESLPTEPQSAESQAEPQLETQPAETQPETQPDPQPIETQPIETQPIAAQPIAAQPKSTQPKSAQPKSTPKSAQPASATPADRPSTGRTFLRMGGQLWSIVVTAIPLALNLLTLAFNLLTKVLKWVWATWNAVLPRVRALLPEPWKTRLPNQIFTAIALALLLLILAVPSWLSGERPEAIARTEQPVPTLPAERPKPAPVVDATKLAKIQDRVVEVTDQYAPGLVQSIQANSRQSRLMVTMDDDWYGLLPDQQDKLANEVLKRSHQLKFDRLEFTDASGTLLARSPMVGSTMLVLERVKQSVDSDRL